MEDIRRVCYSRFHMSPFRSSWAEHLQQTKEAPPSPLLLDALTYVAQKDWALDLGGGGLRDARYLLSEGFRSIAVVDSEPSVQQYASDLPASRVQLFIQTFDTFDFPKETYDLITSQYALPFNSPETFHRVIEGIKGSLKKGGVFCGHLFGDQDEWNVPGTKLTFHTKNIAESLFSDMELIRFDEKNRDATLTNGKPKHWHLFNIIARKPI